MKQNENKRTRAARVLEHALVLGDADAWHGASLVWTLRLTERERAALAWAALRSLDHDAAALVLMAALPQAGALVDPFAAGATS